MSFAKVYDDNGFDLMIELKSNVQNKHRAGGQSAHRFERTRREAIKTWFKDVDRLLKKESGPIRCGINPVYKEQLVSYLSNENKSKILEFFTPEYCDKSGIYQYINQRKSTIERF